MSKELAIIDTISRMLGNSADLANDAHWDSETRLIYTTDMLVESQHFKRTYFSAEDLGWKAAAVNISDIAGMGGQLKYLLVSLGLPNDISTDFIAAFYQGMQAIVQKHHGKIIGGDTVGAPQLIINVTAIGELPVNHQVGCRNQAQPGDYIITSGPHGLSGIGLLVLQHQEKGYFTSKQKHLRPEPCIQKGLQLSKSFERYALMDSSDGLADALLKIAHASGVKLVVAQENITLHPEIEQYCMAHPEQNPWTLILYGGEDFELVGTVPELNETLLKDFQVIGRVEATDRPDEAGAYLAHEGTLEKLEFNQTFQHFQEQAGELE